jgi:hypothetical protein
VPQGVLASFSLDGKKLAYCPKGREEYYWKRYKGGQYVDLWLYDFTTKEHTDLTDYVGKSAYPMWVGDKLYFVSDRGEDGISNLYTYDWPAKRSLKSPFSMILMCRWRPQTAGRSSICAPDISTCSTARATPPQGRYSDPQRPLAAGRPHHQSQRVHSEHGHCR